MAESCGVEIVFYDCSSDLVRSLGDLMPTETGIGDAGNINSGFGMP